MSDQPTIVVHKWRYDDGTRCYVPLCQTSSGEAGWLSPLTDTSKKKLDQTISTLSKKCGVKNEDVRYKKCSIPGGLASMRPSDFPEWDIDESESGTAAMKKLLSSCGEDAQAKQSLLNLVSAILAGYCARECSSKYHIDHIQQKYMRAPVISIKYADYAYIVLEKIVRSLAVNTAVFSSQEYMYSKKPLHVKYQPVLPRKTKDRHITDSAYIKLLDLTHYLMPQYRDTTVLVHCRFFPSSELIDLQRLNPWVSLVFFDAPSKKLLSSPVEVNGSVLARSNCDWDTEKLQYTVERYVSYLTRKAGKRRWHKRIEKYFREIEQLIFQHNTSVNYTPVKYAQKYQVSLQLLALRLYLDACRSDGGIDKEESVRLLADWYQTLLPGCSLDQINLKQNMADLDEPEPFQSQFENALRCILSEDNLQHIFYVPKGSICPPKANSGSPEYWGYLKWYEPKKSGKTPFLSLLMRRSTFETLFQKYCLDYHGENPFKDTKQLDAEYLEGFKARMYKDESDAQNKKTVDALILNVKRMSFLSPELRKMIFDKAPASTEEKPPKEV